MKAIVCDKCGKVVLLEGDSFRYPDEINVLYIQDKGQQIDMCNECTNELLEGIRKENDYERD